MLESRSSRQVRFHLNHLSNRSVLLKRLSVGDISALGDYDSHFTRSFRERVVQSRKTTWLQCKSNRMSKLQETAIPLTKLSNSFENEFIEFHAVSGFCLTKFWNDILKSVSFQDVTLYEDKANGITFAWDGKTVEETDNGLFAIGEIVNDKLNTQRTKIKMETIVAKPRKDWTVSDVTNFIILPTCLETKSKRSISLLSGISRPRSWSGKQEYGKVDPIVSESFECTSPYLKGITTKFEGSSRNNLRCFLNEFEGIHVGRRFQGVYVVHPRSIKFQELVNATKEYMREMNVQMSTEIYFHLGFLSTDFRKLKFALNQKDIPSNYKRFYFQEHPKAIMIVMDYFQMLLSEAASLWECYCVLNRPQVFPVIISSFDTGKLVDDAISTGIIFDAIDNFDSTHITSNAHRSNELLEVIIQKKGNGYSEFQELIMEGVKAILLEELDVYAENLEAIGKSLYSYSEFGRMHLIRADFFFSRNMLKSSFQNYQKAEECFSKNGVEEYIDVSIKDPTTAMGDEYYHLEQNSAFVEEVGEGLALSRLGCAKTLIEIETTNLGYEKIFRLLKKIHSVVRGHKNRNDLKAQANLVKADLLAKMKQPTEAIKYYKGAAASWKGDPEKVGDVVALQRKLSKQYIKLGQTKAALLCLMDATAIINSDKDSTATEAELRKEVADLLLSIGNIVRADQEYQKAQKLIEACVGKWNKRFGTLCFKHAECLMKKGEYKSALWKANRMRVVFTKIFGRQSLKVSHSNYFIGCLWVTLSENPTLNSEETLRYLKKACKNFTTALATARGLKNREKTLEQTVSIAQYALALGQTMQRMGSSKDLYYDLLEEALEIRTREYGATHQLTAEVKKIMKRNTNNTL